MVDLVALMNTLVDGKGKILVPGIYDSVKDLSPEERKLYEPIDFCQVCFVTLKHYKKKLFFKETYCKESGCFSLIHDNKVNTLMHRWRYPSLSIHGIQGAFDGSGAKTVIPRKVTGKFSIRIVPDQDPKEIERLVVQHLETEFKKRNSPNKMRQFYDFRFK